MEFSCKYATATGQVVSSVQVGTNIDDVRHKLAEQGFLPIEIKAKGITFSRTPRKKAIKTDDFILFNQQFVSLIKAGLPILRSIDLLKAQIKNPDLLRHVVDIRERLQSGALLSDAMRKQEVFPPVYVASIAAGERSGDLVEVIQRYVKYEKTSLGVRKRFINSLIYPAFLVLLAITMVGVILKFVIPRFAQLYSELGRQLPAPTRFLIYVSSAVENNFWTIFLSIVGVIVLIRLWTRTRSGRSKLDEWKLHSPLLGTLLTMFSMAQLSRTLGTLLTGGTPLLSALETVRESTGNSAISDSITAACGLVREGKPLSDSLEGTGHFPPLALEMIRVGEQTGALPEMLNHVADYYDEEVQLRSTALLGFVEPVILIFIAVFVAFVLISLYLPLFSIGAGA
ncbi:MAG TPA: type II secretion system F family protein [Terriglobia bacterium]|nr:type II secretion system F family protein [Terriglobia bacterium]